MVIFQKIKKTRKNQVFPRDPPILAKKRGGVGGVPPSPEWYRVKGDPCKRGPG
jgi:hypothetical protein